METIVQVRRNDDFADDDYGVSNSEKLKIGAKWELSGDTGTRIFTVRNSGVLEPGDPSSEGAIFIEVETHVKHRRSRRRQKR